MRFVITAWGAGMLAAQIKHNDVTKLPGDDHL